jgi:hypothetical protein
MPPPYAAIEAGSFLAGAAAGALAWHFTGALLLRALAACAAAAKRACAGPPPPPPEAPDATIARLRGELEALEAELEHLREERGA